MWSGDPLLRVVSQTIATIQTLSRRGSRTKPLRTPLFGFGLVDAIALVAVRGSDLVGFALSNRDELALCYVAPEALHQGVGKGLLRAISRAPCHAVSPRLTGLHADSARLLCA